MSIATTSPDARRSLSRLGAEQQRLAYPDIIRLTLALPAAAFNRVLNAAQSMGWAIVAAEDAAGRIEGSDTSRGFGFTDDIMIRITPSGSGGRIGLRSSSRLRRTDFGVDAARIRGYLAALHAAADGSSWLAGGCPLGLRHEWTTARLTVRMQPRDAGTGQWPHPGQSRMGRAGVRLRGTSSWLGRQARCGPKARQGRRGCDRTDPGCGQGRAGGGHR